VRAPERLWALRVVSTPEALDHAHYEGDVIVLRIANDEAIAIGAVHAELTDEHAIVEVESTFVGWDLSLAEFDGIVHRHVEWPLPAERPALAQGLVAGLPLKFWIDHDRVLMISSNGLVHEVVDRLGVPA
jgi:hypothetical protein